MNPTNSRARYQTHLEHCSLPEFKKKYAESNNQWDTLSNVDKQEEIKEGFPKIFSSYDKQNASIWERFGNKSNPLLVERCTCNLKSGSKNGSKNINVDIDIDKDDLNTHEDFTNNIDHNTACNVALVILFVIFVLFVAYNELPRLGVTYPKSKSLSDNGV